MRDALVVAHALLSSSSCALAADDDPPIAPIADLVNAPPAVLGGLVCVVMIGRLTWTERGTD